MATKPSPFKPSQGLSVFERYLTVWVLLCIAAGIGLGSVVPGIATFLDGLSLYVGDAPVVSIPIAICLFFMMYPIMVKIDFAKVIRAGKKRPAGWTHLVYQLGHQTLQHVCDCRAFSRELLSRCDRPGGG